MGTCMCEHWSLCPTCHMQQPYSGTVHFVIRYGRRSQLSWARLARKCSRFSRCCVCCCCRVAALKALCEMRLDKDDLRAAVDAAGGPRRRTKKGDADESRTLDDFRRAPLGEDARRRCYWYHDFHDTTGGLPACAWRACAECICDARSCAVLNRSLQWRVLSKATH